MRMAAKIPVCISSNQLRHLRDTTSPHPAAPETDEQHHSPSGPVCMTAKDRKVNKCLPETKDIYIYISHCNTSTKVKIKMLHFLSAPTNIFDDITTVFIII